MRDKENNEDKISRNSVESVVEDQGGNLGSRITNICDTIVEKYENEELFPKGCPIVKRL